MNPAAQVAMLLPRKMNATAVKRVVLPCSSASTPPLLVRLATSPVIAAVLLIGEDERYEVPTLELYARNRLHYFIADNDGQQPRDRIAIDEAPPIVSTNVDLARLVIFAAARGVDIATSRDAGSHLCNHTYYFLRHHVSAKLGLLLHVPRTASPNNCAMSESLRTARVLSEYLIGVSIGADLNS